MPNHIQNRLSIIGNDDQVKEVLAAISSKDEDGKEIQIDFNRIKPMPESLHIDSGSLGELAHSLLFGTTKSIFAFDIRDSQRRFAKMDIEMQRKSVELGIEYQFNLEHYGHTTWYDWSIENWGTKWNAYSQNDERSSGNVIYFQTAWSAPVSLIKELSATFPLVTFQLDYADEDSGSNTGKITIKDGEEIECVQPESQSTEAYEIYFDLHPDAKQYYKLVGGKYEYIEEDENV